MNWKVSVIMPAYNVGNIIKITLHGVMKTLEKTSFKYEVIIIDDGSRDETYEAAVNAVKEIRDYYRGEVIVYKLSNNRGKGYALIKGFKLSKGDIIVFFDADSDISPLQIIVLLNALRTYNADAVITSKWHPLSRVRATLLRRMLSKGFNILARMLVGIKVRDTQTGAKAFKRYVLETIIPKLFVKRYAFDLELIAALQFHGFKIIEVPALARLNLNSAFKPNEIIRMFLDTLSVAYRYRLRGTGKPSC